MIRKELKKYLINVFSTGIILISSQEEVTMLIKLFHGGNKLDLRDGYRGGKPGRFIYGVGLYATNSYHWANGYGRTLYTLECDLNADKAAHNVLIPISEVLEFISVNCSKKLYKTACKDFADRESLSCERLEVYLVNNVKSFTKLSLPLCNLFVINGCTHSVEIAGSWENSRLFKIFDFNVISTATKSNELEDQIVPEKLDRNYKKIV